MRRQCENDVLVCFCFITFFHEERCDSSKIVISNVVSCDVKCSYYVFFSIKYKFGTQGVRVQGSYNTCVCMEESVKPRRACNHGPGAHNHAYLLVLRAYIRRSFFIFLVRILPGFAPFVTFLCIFGATSSIL